MANALHQLAVRGMPGLSRFMTRPCSLLRREVLLTTSTPTPCQASTRLCMACSSNSKALLGDLTARLRQAWLEQVHDQALLPAEQGGAMITSTPTSTSMP